MLNPNNINPTNKKNVLLAAALVLNILSKSAPTSLREFTSGKHILFKNKVVL